MSNTNQSKDAAEKNLADQLKKQCDENGREKDPSKSAQLLWQLGRLYAERSPEKMDIIKSAALLNASIARKPENVSEILLDLQSLCCKVLHAADAEQKDADLITKANTIKKALQEVREKVKKSLESIKPIPNADEQTLQKMEHVKIKAIQELQDGIASDYKLIMKNISDYCVNVMGKTPCKFAHVGMGSMARAEITPWSDFENIILLEEGCQKEKNFDTKVCEYFRWYSVMFQIILINLQETILPSVSIISLNNMRKKTDDWFYDGVTTRGVSFDGMMPYACKSPLGRQAPTQLKPWKTELIKPVSEMLQYLTTEHNLKNGYHLSDILTKTCFVYGEKAIYDQFFNGVQNTLSSCNAQTVRDQIISQIKEDIDSFGTKISLSTLENKTGFNFKRIVYRSTTLFISALGRLFNVEGNSCFQVLRSLEKRHVLSSKAKQKLDYAVALACEIRLKIYMKDEGQNDWIPRPPKGEGIGSPLLEVIGQSSCISYFQIAYSLQFDTCRLLKIKQSHFYSDLLLMNLSIFQFLGLSGMADKLLSVCSDKLSTDTQVHNFDSCLTVLEDGMNEASNDTHDHFNLLQSKQSNRNKAEHYLKISLFVYNAKKYNEVVEFGKKILNLKIEFEEDTASLGKKAYLLYIIGHSLHEMRRFKEAHHYFTQCLEIWKTISKNPESDEQIANTCNYIGSCLMEANKFNTAIPFYKKALNIYIFNTVDEDSDIEISNALHNIGLCLRETDKYSEGVVYLEKSLKICQRISPDKSTDRHLASMLNNFGLSLMDANRVEEALITLKESLQIYKNVSVDKDTEKKIARAYLNIGCCLEMQNKCEEAKIFLQKSLKICQGISIDDDFEGFLAVILDNLGSLAYV